LNPAFIHSTSGNDQYRLVNGSDGKCHGGRIMPSPTRRLAFLVVALLVVGCASSAGTPRAGSPLQTPDRFSVSFRSDVPRFSDTLHVPIDVVWQVVPVVYRELGYPAAAATNTRERVYMTPFMTIGAALYAGERNSTYIDCGTGFAGNRADSHEVSFAIVTRVVPGRDNSPMVETLIDGSARPRDASSSPVPCTGTGKLERVIGNLIRRKVLSGNGA
jgi:hypothetical protein